jgi:hypothetical protein
MALETDDELLGYASIHCRTERALFHRDHVRRLYKLARQEPPALPEWVTMREDVADPLIKRARGFARLRLV